MTSTNNRLVCSDADGNLKSQDASIGSAGKPVYVNSNGVLVAGNDIPFLGSSVIANVYSRVSP